MHDRVISEGYWSLNFPFYLNQKKTNKFKHKQRFGQQVYQQNKYELNQPYKDTKIYVENLFGVKSRNTGPKLHCDQQELQYVSKMTTKELPNIEQQ